MSVRLRAVRAFPCRSRFQCRVRSPQRPAAAPACGGAGLRPRHRGRAGRGLAGRRAQQAPQAPDDAASSAQGQRPQQLQRVQVTGSAIKRLAGEGALPVQTLTRNDIVKAGVTTAAELMATVSAMSNALTDGVSIGTGGFKDQMGFNSANLRGLGTSSTLVLLNGRRLANFASPGDDNGVDLNNIPAAAIERVEVLLDGASAIYGTDAIGGVINFITRKDYQGLQLDVYGGVADEGGASKRTASIAAGHGDIDRDGFNVMGVLDFQRTGSLRTSQRKFIDDLRIPERLPHLLSSAGFPGNIRLSGDQFDYLSDPANGFTLNGKTISSRQINLSIPQCQAPHTLYLPAGIGGVERLHLRLHARSELYPKRTRAASWAAACSRSTTSTRPSSRPPTRAARAGTSAPATASTRIWTSR
ncbi:tonB-dependent receptor plug domain-containing protein [Ditylenchus destructor]|nr:tonB-dependent receptor plug domain-containing protein [Ditylenchus destructor]